MEEIMESKTRYKYAIVRLKEGDLKDFFNLLVSKGYFEVSFVGNLHQAMAKPDPNEEGENAPSTSTKNDDRSVQLADSEDRFSVVATPPEDATPPAPLKKQSPLDLFLNPKIEEMEQENEEAGAFLNGSTSSELLSHLFPSHGLNIEAWSNELQNMNGLNGLAAAIMPRHQVAALNNRHSPYKNIFHQQQKDMNQGAFQTRMKGWQREYIKDIINNGHYPTEDELKEIEQKCDLSRKQVLRFIAKRLVNPNRKQRADSVVRLSATTTPVKDGEGEGEGEEGFAGNESDTPDSSDVHH